MKKQKIEICAYQSFHRSGINQMMNGIALEFDETIFSKPTKNTPLVPDNYWVALHDDKVIGTIGLII
ncbi:hypothetical protein, partial [Xanthovirga aplysinae]|uniref:hypothetical protein n=1 Tax=Xanthovirga aplysinae TaxID=2529853 RepID=UPI0012BC6E0A